MSKSKKNLSLLGALLALGGIGGEVPSAATPNVVTEAPAQSTSRDGQNPQATAAPIQTASRSPDAPKYFPARGWVYVGVRALPVAVLAKVGNTYRVRFMSRKMGLRGHVGPVGGVTFTAPHLTGGRS